jgi:polyribonucleotide nucleotidyltransferase
MTRRQKEDYLKKLITNIDKYPHIDKEYKKNIISIYNNALSLDDKKFNVALLLIKNLVAELNNSYKNLNNNLIKNENKYLEEQEKNNELKNLEKNFNF